MLFREIIATLISSLLFFIVSHPEIYKVTQKVLGRFFTVATTGGLPTLAGLILHSLVFAVCVYFYMIYGGREFLEGEDEDMYEDMDEEKVDEKAPPVEEE